MLHGTLWDKIPRFAIPVAATAILSQLFNAADIAVIGNFTGELRTVAVAAVGTNSSIISLIVNLFIGIALGANVTIAHAIGEKNDTMVHHAVHTSIVVAVLGGLIAAIIGELFAVPLLNQLNVPDDVFPLALLYLRIYLAGLPVILLYNFEAAVFRSVGEIKRCKKTLLLCLLEGIISLGVAIALILFFGKSLLTIFNGDPQVVETGYIRLMLIMPSHLFSLCYEVLSGYLRGFEISLPPAVLTMLGVCGVRLSWLRWVFPQYKTFMNIMLVFPISLATTALLMLAAVLYFRPSRRYAHLQKSDGAASAKIEG